MSSLQLHNGVPHLADVTAVAVEILCDTTFSPSLHRDNQNVRLLMEGLFEHFFSSYRPSYHPEDAHWFMELANDQTQWLVTDVSRSVIARSFSEALDQEAVTPSRSVETEVGLVRGCGFQWITSCICPPGHPGSNQYECVQTVPGSSSGFQ